MSCFHQELSILASFGLKNDPYTVAGIDEVGRGALAGPVVACCVVFKKTIPLDLLHNIKDSKLLTKKQRERLVLDLKKYTYYALAEVPAEKIDKLNILQATLVAMRDSYLKLKKRGVLPSCLIIDGNKVFDYDEDVLKIPLIQGDRLSVVVASASILAKVYRDKLMARFAKRYPYYAWDKNAGYGTVMHKQGIKDYGITDLHRKSFKGCR